MENEDFIEATGGAESRKVIHSGGVLTTVCNNRFEILAKPLCEVNEQQAVLALREWLQKRRQENV